MQDTKSPTSGAFCSDQIQKCFDGELAGGFVLQCRISNPQPLGPLIQTRSKSAGSHVSSAPNHTELVLSIAKIPVCRGRRASALLSKLHANSAHVQLDYGTIYT